ncbi:DUF6732 family protein [Yoonia sp.]|uniref:DUF6732 family protein n=1 Tax=Yoonia sp. TaxID=2212373 RepID=UPI0028A13CFB|nr:DUF6732 family protein [Yoonia sp.]
MKVVAFSTPPPFCPIATSGSGPYTPTRRSPIGPERLVFQRLTLLGDQGITSSDLLLRDCGGLWLMRAEHGGHMQYSLTFLLLVVGSTAQADPGHLAGLAGHDHWVGGAAIGLAILGGLYGALKGKKDAKPDPEVEDERELA